MTVRCSQNGDRSEIADTVGSLDENLHDYILYASRCKKSRSLDPCHTDDLSQRNDKWGLDESLCVTFSLTWASSQLEQTVLLDSKTVLAIQETTSRILQVSEGVFRNSTERSCLRSLWKSPQSEKADYPVCNVYAFPYLSAVKFPKRITPLCFLIVSNASDTQMASPTEPHSAYALALVGNPGSGKSTILNGIVGHAVFDSGVSIGSGFTTTASSYYTHGYTLCDSPGLADVERRGQAAKELDKVLSQRIPIKIAFVVTLENGRVRPEDAMTIDLVLSALKHVDTNDRFGIIINQMTHAVLAQLTESTTVAAMLRRQLAGEHHTSHWIYLCKHWSLIDRENGLLMTPELANFLASLPETKPMHAKVVPIDISAMPEEIEKQAQRIRQLQSEIERNKAQLAELQHRKSGSKVSSSDRKSDRDTVRPPKTSRVPTSKTAEGEQNQPYLHNERTNSSNCEHAESAPENALNQKKDGDSGRRKQRQSHWQHPSIALSFIGNPGVGKSSILNGILGRAEFKTGISIGASLTRSLQDCEHNDIMVFDTPGLAEVGGMKNAARELNKLLATRLPMKIAFVVALENGRVRAEDAVTIDVVLSALESNDLNNCFGVIVNQLSDQEMSQLKNKSNEALMRTMLLGRRNTCHWLHIAREASLTDQFDVMLATEELKIFAEHLPITKPADAQVSAIDISSMEKRMEQQDIPIGDLQSPDQRSMRYMVAELERQKEVQTMLESRVYVLEEDMRHRYDRYAGLESR